MISLPTKTETTSSSALNTPSVSEDEPSTSFSELLHGFSDKKETKVIQNGLLTLDLEAKETLSKDNPKSLNSLLSLLKNEMESTIELKEDLELNPQITTTLTTKDLKLLVSDAKEYLKNKILENPEYKKFEVSELPKTLKGLSSLAKKLNIDVSKITIQEVSLSKNDTKKESKIESLLNKNEVKKDNSPTTTKEKINLKNELRTEETPKVSNQKENQLDKFQEIKNVAIFKPQTSTKILTTEQFVTTKQFTLNEKTPKIKADDTLKLLLRGEKPSQKSSSLTPDFTLSTAKVIPASQTTQTTKNLESLLHSEPKEPTTTPKIDSLGVHKSDSFEVKVNEAKQMIKYLSNDVKSAIEDYKSPFTRIKVQLNPQKLGDVELTVVQRGKNLHINLSSNTSAINTLSMNINELRVQLNNSGINNATLNFNNNPQSQDGSSQQQNHQERREANKEYNYFESQEENEEILSSLEIIVPHYA